MLQPLMRTIRAVVASMTLNSQRSEAATPVIEEQEARLQEGERLVQRDVRAKSRIFQEPKS